MNPTYAASQLRRGVLGPLVLAILENHDRYGLELVRTLSLHGLIASEGTVYPLLTRLLDEGLVNSEWVVSDEHRPRRFYQLTPKGKEELGAFRIEWPRFKASVDTLITYGKDQETHR